MSENNNFPDKEKADNSLNEIQQVELEILKVLLEVFKKHNIRYYILGGTLLGAVRHHGFIPWDDDIDLGIPRPDYEKLLPILSAELEYPLCLQTFSNKRRNSGLYFAQVANEEFPVKKLYAGSIVTEYAWIDLFPLDGVPDKKLDFFIWKKKCMLLSKLFSLSQTSKIYDVSKGNYKNFSSGKEKTIYFFLKCRLSGLLKENFLWKELDRNLKKYSFDKSKSLINFCGFWRMKEMFPKSVYGEGKKYIFEDVLLTGPVDYDRVLSQMYGDYMTPPNIENRNHHKTEL